MNGSDIFTKKKDVAASWLGISSWGMSGSVLAGLGTSVTCQFMVVVFLVLHASPSKVWDGITRDIVGV